MSDGCPGDGESIRRLAAALTWEAGGSGQGRSLAVSLVFHIAALAPFCLAGSVPSHKAIDEKGFLRASVTLVPAAVQSPPQPRSMPPAKAGMPAPDASGAPAKLKVDLDRIQVDFAVDEGNQLQEVVKRRGGELALLEKDDRDYAESLFLPPDWSRISGPKNVSDRYIVLMEPARDWRIFGDLAGRYDIDLDRYQGAALFDMGYRHCVEEAISAKASSQPNAGGRVTIAHLRFTLANPCGITALEVEFAAR